MKNHIKVNMHDTFSGCTESKELKNCSNEKLKILESIQINGNVINEVSNSISYNWVIDEIEILN